MSEGAPLTVVLLTAATSAERAEYAYATLHAALHNIIYTDGPLFVHIADDGSAEVHRNVCKEIAGGYSAVRGVSSTNAERRGYGASYNLATQAVHHRGGFVLPLEDDWRLHGALDADALVAALGDPIQCIRLGYLGWTQELRGTIIGRAEGTFLLLDPESPEHHVFAGHPRIETIEFERAVGEWPEGLDAGTTEFVVARRPASRLGVAWPLATGPFAHIGTVQARQDQQESHP